MGFDRFLFRLTSWVRETTSYMSPTIQTIDREDGHQRPGNDQVLNNRHQRDHSHEQDPFDENDENGENDENEFVSEEKVALPRKRKVYFYVFYVIFLVLYVTLVLVTTCKYPLKPDYYIDFEIPVFEKESGNVTEEMKQSVYLNLWLKNRNQLASVSYEDLNITMFYHSSSNTSTYFASTLAPWFYKNKPNPMEVNVHMPATGLSGLLEMKEEFNNTIFRVNLEFMGRFDCKLLCKQKHRFVMVEDIKFSFRTGKTE